MISAFSFVGWGLLIPTKQNTHNTAGAIGRLANRIINKVPTCDDVTCDTAIVLGNPDGGKGRFPALSLPIKNGMATLTGFEPVLRTLPHCELVFPRKLDI